MKNKKGLFIIEVMLYVALASWLFVLIFRFASNEQELLFGSVRKMHSYINLNKAADIFMRDIRQAPASIELWKKIEPGGIAWHSKDRSIGWEIKKDKIVRIYGTFIENENKWKGSNRTYLAQQISNAEFIVEKDSQSKIVKCVIVRIETKDASIERMVYLKSEK